MSLAWFRVRQHPEPNILWGSTLALATAFVYLAVGGAFKLLSKNWIIPNHTVDLFFSLGIHLVFAIAIIFLVLIYRKNLCEINWMTDKPLLDLKVAVSILPLFLAVSLVMMLLLHSSHISTTPTSGSDRVFDAYTMSSAQFLLFLLLDLFVAPVSEEIIWRGFIFQGLKARFTPSLALVIQGGLFSASHWRYNPSEFLFLFLAGLVLGVVFQIRKNVIAPIILHILINSFFAILLINDLGSVDKIGSLKPESEKMQERFNSEWRQEDVQKRIANLQREAFGGDKEAKLQEIIASLSDPSELVRAYALSLLIKKYEHNAMSVRSVLMNGKPQIIDDVLTAICVNGDRSLIPEIETLTEHPDAQVRKSSLLALYRLQATTSLKKALKSNHADTRGFAAKLIARKNFGTAEEDNNDLQEEAGNP